MAVDENVVADRFTVVHVCCGCFDGVPVLGVELVLLKVASLMVRLSCSL